MIKGNIYDFQLLNVAQAEEYNGLLESVTAGRLDGFIIQDFLSQEEVEAIKTGYYNLKQSEKVIINPTFNSYPVSFAQLEQFVQSGSLTEEEYFEKSHNFTATFLDIFGVDLESKFRKLYHLISNKEYQSAYYKEESNRFVPYNFRELKYPGGNLKSHCEQYFMNEFPSFYSRLASISNHDAQLSFFIVLSNPVKGGELTLFNALWPDFKKRIGDQIVVEEATGNQYDLDKGQIESMSIKTEVGSLLVFSGGNIWHRVEGVEEGPARLTLGGFISFSFDKKIMYPWS